MKKFFNSLSIFIYCFSSLLFQEVVFSLIIFGNIKFDTFLNVLLTSIIFSSIISFITSFLKEKGNTILLAIILFVNTFLFSAQLVFYNTFKVFFSMSIIGLGDQLTSFMKETINAIINNIFYIMIMFIPFILFFFIKRKLNLERIKLKTCFIYLIILLLGIGLYSLNIYKTKGNQDESYYLYHDINNVSLNIEKLGVIESYLVDTYRTIFGFSETIVIDNIEKIEEEEQEIVYEKNTLDISFDKGTSNNDIKTINNYMKSIDGTSQNEYTGKYKGYNLVYIVAESFSEIAVSEELTPTLYKLTHSGLVFDNYYTPNTLSTIGGEFQGLTGLYPDGSILSKWRKGNNYFPYGLATVYKNLGYKTYAYHNNWYAFQDRHKYLKSQGFTNYLGCYNGLQKRMNCKRWPQSDLEMMKVTIPDYINNEEPFLAYYMTVSGHFSYNFSENNMASKNKKYVNNLNVSTAAKAYVATQIELDRALEYLINKLDESGKLDNTVIVLMADHYPYKLDLNSINSLSSYKRDSLIEVNHNALILWNSKEADTHIEKPCMSSDVLPTIYNLFGIEYDSRLFTGRDILSTSDGLVVFSNRSWITEKGVYHANTKKFDAKEEVPENYVSDINNLVKNRLNVAKLIVKNDYYKYLLK